MISELGGVLIRGFVNRKNVPKMSDLATSLHIHVYRWAHLYDVNYTYSNM